MTTANYNPFEILERRLDTIQDMLSGLNVPQASQASESTNIEKFVDSKKVQEIYEVSNVTVWDWENKGILRSYRIGKLKRFKLSEVLSAPQLIQRKTKLSSIK